MISPELLRRYPFFAGLDHGQLARLAMMADIRHIDAGHELFREGDTLESFYLVMEGKVAIVINVTARDVAQPISRQLTGAIETSEVSISHVGPGEPFGWTALTPIHTATAGARAVTACELIVFDRRDLLASFAQEPAFGYLMQQQVLQVAARRIHDLRIESLAQSAA